MKGSVDSISAQPDKINITQKAVRSLASSIYQKMQDEGFKARDIISVSSQLIDMVTIELQKEDFQKTGVALGESAGLIDLLKITQGIKYAVLLTETEGEVHGQIRTVQPEVNVAEIARRLGGGGHTQAAAFRIKGKLERREEEWVIVEESRIAF